jgi:oligopeptide/dipeptide ABC transporter ATP-binding protein
MGVAAQTSSAAPPAAPGATEPVLSVEGLGVSFRRSGQDFQAVDGLTVDLAPGGALGIVGESGSGKSVTARAVMGVLPRTAVVTGSIRLAGTELVGLPEKRYRALRGAVVSMIYQDPMRSLNPTMRIGRQLGEAINAHGRSRNRSATAARALELLDHVRMPAARERLRSYPHELSGGMRQRVMIALALASSPKLLIADEPTTALDVTVQAQILDLLDELRRELGMSLVLVTHDLAVAAERTDEIAVMYAGRIVERASTATLFATMRMPYTRALIDSTPGPDDEPHSLLRAIPGRPPVTGAAGTGCAFLPRCARAAELDEGKRERCAAELPTLVREHDHESRCWYPLEPVAVEVSRRNAHV